MNYDFIKQHHYQLITRDEARFIFEQSEKHLKDLIDTSQQIATKTTNLLTIVSGVLIGLISFGITRWITSGFGILTATAFGASAYLYYVVCLLLKNIKPSLYKSVGLHPRRIFDDKLFNDGNKDYRLEALYINEIIECQKRIDFNSVTNDTRWRRFNLAIRLVSYLPGTILLLYCVIHLLVLLW